MLLTRIIPIDQANGVTLKKSEQMRELLFKLFLGFFIVLGDLRDLLRQNPAQFTTQNAKEMSLGRSLGQNQPLPGTVRIRVKRIRNSKRKRKDSPAEMTKGGSSWRVSSDPSILKATSELPFPDTGAM